jgi:hypothetical protein
MFSVSKGEQICIHSLIPARTLESNSLLVTFLVPTDQPVCKIIISESYINLWGRPSLFMRAQLGNLEWTSTRDFEIWSKGALEVERLSHCGSAVKGTWREVSLAGDPEGYVEKALETGISFRRGPFWGSWRRARLTESLRDG